MEDQIFNYYYIDENSIDSLFAQLDKSYIDKVAHKSLNTTKGSGRGKIGLSSLFRTLGVGEANLEAKLSTEKMSSEEFSEVLLVEHKIKAILDSLKEEKKLVSLTKENFDSTAIQKVKFVELEALFRTPEFQEQVIAYETARLNESEMKKIYYHQDLLKSWHEEQNRVHRLVMTNTHRPDLCISKGFVTFTCRLGKSLIHMGTSLIKYTVGLHHLMIAWHHRKVMLIVFGQITPINENEFYLKPYTIRHA